MIPFTVELHIPPPTMDNLKIRDVAILVKYLESKPKN